MKQPLFIMGKYPSSFAVWKRNPCADLVTLSISQNRCTSRRSQYLEDLPWEHLQNVLVGTQYAGWGLLISFKEILCKRQGSGEISGSFVTTSTRRSRDLLVVVVYETERILQADAVSTVRKQVLLGKSQCLMP